jgi:hypothetical protein
MLNFRLKYKLYKTPSFVTKEEEEREYLQYMLTPFLINAEQTLNMKIPVANKYFENKEKIKAFREKKP